LVGNLTFYQFNIILSGVCTVVTTVVIFAKMVMHATHMSNPKEQLKYVPLAWLAWRPMTPFPKRKSDPKSAG